MTRRFDLPGLVRIVFADANVLYSRVLRDYLLYAADEEIIGVTWSARVLREATEHLVANVPAFTTDSAARLLRAMGNAFPYAEVQPTATHYDQLAGFVLPDEGDRHVLAAALAAEATVLCTANTRDFPADVTDSLGLEVMAPGALLSALIAEYPSPMIAVHAMVVARLRGSTNSSTPGMAGCWATAATAKTAQPTT